MPGMSNHRHCCCDDNCFPIEEYLNTGHGTGCEVIGSRPPISYGCCGDNGGGDDCESVDCGSNWSFALEVMIQRVAKVCSWGDFYQAGVGCDGGTACGSGGTTVPDYCCCEDCGGTGVSCATMYDAQVVEVSTNSANWAKVGTATYTQTVSTTLGPYESVDECCLTPNGADLATVCDDPDCVANYSCDQPGTVENGLIMQYSTAKVNMDDEGLPLDITFRMVIRADRTECFIERVNGPHGFDGDSSYDATYDLWVEGVGPSTISKGVLLPITWGAGDFRCYCNNATNVVGDAITWGTTVDVGFTPTNGEDYTDGPYDWGARRPFYMTRHLRCYISGDTYEGPCGNCGPWVDVRCWLGNVYEN